jgi:LEA14-like dessication related protein
VVKDSFGVSSIELYPRASRRRGSVKSIVVLLVIALLVYLGLLYYSGMNVEISVDKVGFSSPGQLLNILTSRRLSIDVYLNVKGRGVLPINVKSFSSNIYLEGQYVGFVNSSQPFTIEPGETLPVHLVLTLDVSSTSAQSLASIVQTVIAHNGKVKVTLDGKVDVLVLFFSVDVPVRRETYVSIAPSSSKS